MQSVDQVQSRSDAGFYLLPPAGGQNPSRGRDSRHKGVGVVLDGDGATLRDALELRGEHALRNRRLVRLAPGGGDRHVELHLLAAAHVRLSGGANRVRRAGSLDAGGPELLRQLCVGGLRGHVTAARRLLHAAGVGHRILRLLLHALHLVHEAHPGIPPVRGCAGARGQRTGCPHAIATALDGSYYGRRAISDECRYPTRDLHEVSDHSGVGLAECLG